MDRDIIVYGSEELSTADYIKFAKKCFEAWNAMPVKDIDLIVEFQSGFKSPTLRNTPYEWIYGMAPCSNSFEKICKFAETELHCLNYIVAKIRNGEVVNIEIKKG